MYTFTFTFILLNMMLINTIYYDYSRLLLICIEWYTNGDILQSFECAQINIE